MFYLGHLRDIFYNIMMDYNYRNHIKIQPKNKQKHFIYLLTVIIARAYNEKNTKKLSLKCLSLSRFVVELYHSVEYTKIVN